MGGANLSCLAGALGPSKTPAASRLRVDKGIGFPCAGCYRIGVVLFRRALLLALPLMLLTALAPVRPAVAQGRPDCTEVLREFHHHHGSDSGLPDAAKIASKLETDAAWVEKCAATYGRRVKAKDAKPTEDDSQGLTAKVEEKEFEETGREERDDETDTNVAQGDEGTYKDRDRVREIDPDSSAEWEPYLTHEWEPKTSHEWEPYLLDDDHPNEE